MRHQVRSGWGMGAVLGLGVLLAASPAGAATVYSNLGPGDSFGDDFWALGFQGGDQARANDLAVSFSLGDVAYHLDSAELAVRRFDGVSDLVSVQLFSDAGGVPGAAVTAVGPVALPDDNPPPLTAVDFGGTFVLQPHTTYWLVVDADRSLFGGWHWNVTGDTGLATRADDDPWNSFGDRTAPAFRINGTAVSSVIPTPLAAPAGLALLAGIGLRRSGRRL